MAITLLVRSFWSRFLIFFINGQSSSRFTSFLSLRVARRKELSSDWSLQASFVIFSNCQLRIPSYYVGQRGGVHGDRAIAPPLDYRSRFPFSRSANVTRPVYHLRSVRADHTHVEVVAQLHLQLGLPVLIGPVRRYRWRWWRWRRTAISLTISLASRRPVFLAFSRVVMVVMSGVAVNRQSGVRGLAAVGLMPGGQRWR